MIRLIFLVLFVGAACKRGDTSAEVRSLPSATSCAAESGQVAALEGELAGVGGNTTAGDSRANPPVRDNAPAGANLTGALDRLSQPAPSNTTLPGGGTRPSGATTLPGGGARPNGAATLPVTTRPAGRTEADIRFDLAAAYGAMNACRGKLPDAAQNLAQNAAASLCASVGGALVDAQCVCGKSGVSQTLAVLQMDQGASCRDSAAKAPFAFAEKCAAEGGRMQDALCQCGEGAYLTAAAFERSAGAGCHELGAKYPFAAAQPEISGATTPPATTSAEPSGTGR